MEILEIPEEGYSKWLKANSQPCAFYSCSGAARALGRSRGLFVAAGTEDRAGTDVRHDLLLISPVPTSAGIEITERYVRVLFHCVLS